MNNAPYAPYGVEMATTLARGVTIGAHGAGGFVSSLVRLPVAAFKVLMTWQDRISERNRLRHMDDRLLRDMGLSRTDVEREASIPFYRAS